MRTHFDLIWFVYSVVLLALVPSSYAETAVDQVIQRSKTLWEKHAPYCKDAKGRTFPSKIDKNGKCDDRDSVMFNGLLCASGMTSASGCEFSNASRVPHSR